MQASSLRLEYCSAKAARYAVRRWHYSKRLPIGPLVKVGVWEGGAFIGVVLFGRGACAALGNPYGLHKTEVCELVRIALRQHSAPVSRIVRIALALLRKQCPGIQLVVSFADPFHGHVGGIYQAGNWIYTGMSASIFEYWHAGRWKHSREASGGAFGGKRQISRAQFAKLQRRKRTGKHRYLMGLDVKTRAMIEALKQPYPKRQPIEGACYPAGIGGADPTLALQGIHE